MGQGAVGVEQAGSGGFHKDWKSSEATEGAALQAASDSARVGSSPAVLWRTKQRLQGCGKQDRRQLWRRFQSCMMGLTAEAEECWKPRWI